jgi:hypothetical protein
MRVTHAWTDDTATIQVEGLQKVVRMMHVTDSHCGLMDERDARHEEPCRDFCQRFAGNERILAERLREARELEVDLVALTGDIIHFPSRASVDYVAGEMGQLEAPVLFTCGNHDWRFPGLSDQEAVREVWWPTLAPLHGGEAGCAAHEAGGIQFLRVDDSTYQVDVGQLAWMRERLSTGRPTVVLSHIPLSLPTLRAPTIEKWKAPILIGDPDWGSESRERWKAGEDLPSTLRYVQLLSSAENLVAIFCGHVHFPHADAVNPRAVQYVGGLGFEGARRVVEFRPL